MTVAIKTVAIKTVVLAIGTRKGLFLARSDDRTSWDL